MAPSPFMPAPPALKVTLFGKKRLYVPARPDESGEESACSSRLAPPETVGFWPPSALESRRFKAPCWIDTPKVSELTLGRITRPAPPLMKLVPPILPLIVRFVFKAALIAGYWPGFVEIRVIAKGAEA